MVTFCTTLLRCSVIHNKNLFSLSCVGNRRISPTLMWVTCAYYSMICLVKQVYGLFIPRIISDFQGHCAYCLVQPYSVIEMVKPYKGLMRDNVVPICRACQVHKQNGFESAEERIEAYVESEPTIHLFEDEPEAWEVEA